MKIKKYLVYFLMIINLIMLSSCGDTPKKEERKEKVDDKIEIGLSFDSFVIERWERDRDIFLSKANELGAEVNVQSANGDIETQKKQIEYFIEKEVDAIVIVAIDGDSLSEEVEKAHKKGIKVIAYDRLIKNANVDLFISFDNQRVGELMAEYIAKGTSENANVIMIQGDTKDNNVTEVYNGFKAVASQNGINIVEKTNIDGWKSSLAYDYVQENLSKFEQVDAIMCGNDGLAEQTIQALSENRMIDNKIIVGQDADIEACQRIVEGTQYMTVYKPIDALAETAAISTLNLINGEEEKYTGSMFDGTNYVSYVAIKPFAVTKENMDDVIIDGGFHLKEEVYLNVSE